MSGVDPAELDEWLEKVEEVHQTISGLRSGEVDVKQADQLLHKLGVDVGASAVSASSASSSAAAAAGAAASAAAGEEAKRQLAAETAKQGRTGKGEKDNYELFCRRCHLEYTTADVKECAKCSGALMTREERRSELKNKVDQLLQQKRDRQRRRERFQLWKAQREEKGEKGTDYASWDFWEPDSDEEDGPMQTPNDPAFKALERDLDERQAKRAAAAREANEHKEKGNAAFKRNDYVDAIKHYTKAIEIKRDDKLFYTNRAQAHLRLNQLAEAKKDCTTALEIWEVLDERRRRPFDCAPLKAYFHRATALRELGDLEAALQDVDAALSLSQWGAGVHLMPTPSQLAAMSSEARAEATAVSELHKLRSALSARVKDRAKAATVRSESAPLLNATAKSIASPNGARANESNNATRPSQQLGVAAEAGANVVAANADVSSSAAALELAASGQVRLDYLFIRETLNTFRNYYRRLTGGARSADSASAAVKREADAAARRALSTALTQLEALLRVAVATEAGKSLAEVAAAPMDANAAQVAAEKNRLFFRECDGLSTLSSLVVRAARRTGLLQDHSKGQAAERKEVAVAPKRIKSSGLVACALHVLAAAILDSEEATEALVMQEKRALVPAALSLAEASDRSVPFAVREAALELLVEMTRQSASARDELAPHGMRVLRLAMTEATRAVDATAKVESKDSQWQLQSEALTLLSNAAFHPKVKQLFSEVKPAVSLQLAELLPQPNAQGGLLRVSPAQSAVYSAVLSAMANALTDAGARAALVAHSPAVTCLLGGLGQVAGAVAHWATAASPEAGPVWSPAELSARLELLEKLLAVAANCTVESAFIAQAASKIGSAVVTSCVAIVGSSSGRVPSRIRQNGAAMLARFMRDETGVLRQALLECDGISAVLRAMATAYAEAIAAGDGGVDEEHVSLHDRCLQVLARCSAHPTFATQVAAFRFKLPSANAQAAAAKATVITGPALLISLTSLQWVAACERIPVHAALCLGALFRNKDIVVQHGAGAIDPLLLLMSKGTPAAKNAALAVAQLAQHHEAFRNAIREKGGMQMLAVYGNQK